MGYNIRIKAFIGSFLRKKRTKSQPLSLRTSLLVTYKFTIYSSKFTFNFDILLIHSL